MLGDSMLYQGPRLGALQMTVQPDRHASVAWGRDACHPAICAWGTIMHKQTNPRRKTLAACLAAALAVGSVAAVANDQPAPANPAAVFGAWDALIPRATAPAAFAAPVRDNRGIRANRNARADNAPVLRRPLARRDGQLRAQAMSAGPIRPAALLEVTNCDDSGPGSLREVAGDALDGDVIAMHRLSCSTISLTSGAIVLLADGVTLLGPGQDRLTIDGNQLDGVLYSYSLALVDLTIANGSRPSSSGGCIDAFGDLELTRTTVTGCTVGEESWASHRLGGVAGLGAGGVGVTGDLVMVRSTISHSKVMSPSFAHGGGSYVSGNAYLSHSTISNNSAQAIANEALGGGLMVRGVAYLMDSTVSDNAVRSVDRHAYGGGIHIYGAGVAAQRSTISGNTAHSDAMWSYGGGLNVGDFFSAGDGMIVLQESTLAGNSVTANCNYCVMKGGGGNAFGWAMFLDSTISGNTAQALQASEGIALGGGVAAFPAAGPAIAMYRSTVSGNAALGGEAEYGRGEGGGLFGNQGAFGLFNSTITANRASTLGGGFSGAGGSVASALTSTIVAANAAPAGADITGWDEMMMITGSHNLVMAVDNVTLPGDTLSGSPGLLPLANNGGPTRTHALAGCSPAVDTGTDPWGDQDFDQRGAPFVRDYGIAVDIGAFELQPDADRIFGNGFDVLPCP